LKKNENWLKGKQKQKQIQKAEDEIKA
jgi:hypothetical protein